MFKHLYLPAVVVRFVASALAPSRALSSIIRHPPLIKSVFPSGNVQFRPRPFVRALSSSDQTKPFHDLKSVIDNAFKNTQPNPLYSDRSLTHESYVNALQDNHALSIINLPEITLGLKLVTLDVHKLVDDCVKIFGMPSDPRMKPLLATVKGTGGGKTRALEELRLALLKRGGILPLAITFNSYMGLGIDEEYRLENGTLKFNYAYAIVKRLAGVLYGIQFSGVERNFITPTIMESYASEPDVEQELIRAFIAHAAEKTKMQQVVVLLDEAKRADEVFIPPRRGSNKDLDINSCLRMAILDRDIVIGNGGKLNTALVMSSLAIQPTGATRSGRRITPIYLGPLDPSDIVKEIWKIPSDIDIKESRTIHGNIEIIERPVSDYWIPLATALSPLPRLVECAMPQLPSDWKTWKPSTKTSADVLLKVKDAIQGRYGSTTISLAQINAIVFGKLVDIADRDTSDALSNSIYSNSLKKIDREMSFVPEASLAFLSAIVPEQDDLWTRKLSELFHKLSPEHDGDALEWCFQWWLELRLAVLYAGAAVTFQLTALLTEMNKYLPDSLKNFEFEIRTEPYFGRLRNSQYLQNEKDQNPVKAQNLDKAQNPALAEELVKLLELDQPMVLRSAERDAFDALLVVNGVEGPLFLFFDCKSCRYFNPIPVRFKKTQAEKIGNYIKDHLQKAVDEYLNSTTQPKPLKARFAYVYVSTYDGNSKVDNTISDFPIITLTKNNSKEFFGPLFPVYESIRALSTVPTEDSAATKLPAPTN